MSDWRISRGLKPAIVAVLMAIAVVGGLATTSPGQATATDINIINETTVPIYGRTYLGDDEWSAVAFYYTPECVPDDYPFFGGELVSLVKVDFSAFGCQTPTVEAQVHVRDGRVTRQSVSGNGAVPIWLVPTETLMSSLDGTIDSGDVFTFEDLKGIPHLEGTAGHFIESNNTPVIGQPDVHMNAKGVLDDGRSFSFSSQYHLGRGIFDDMPSQPQNGVVHIR